MAPRAKLKRKSYFVDERALKRAKKALGVKDLEDLSDSSRYGAAKDKHLRVIDESDEDYLYPADYLVPLTLPRDVERALSAALR